MPASDDLEVLEGAEVCKAGMVGLDVDEPGHLAQRLKVLSLALGLSFFYTKLEKSALYP